MLRTACVAASLALLAASPGNARISGGTSGGWPVPPRKPLLDVQPPGPGIERQARHIGRKVERARESGAISRREARQLRREARLIDSLGYQYGRDGFSASEHAELQNRIFYLESRLLAAGGRSSDTSQGNQKGR
jgi:hypothetical protein